ncbi:MAG: sigma 54-interacting transcriptional regulator, partial [Desulfobacterales bacterium]
KQEPKIIECEGIVGSSALMKECLYSMARAAAGGHNILITGETGTGKELLAKAVHQNSPRAEKNFIIVDCAALKDTLLESTLFGHEKGAFTGAEARREGLVSLADGGTLFLDEIGELDLDAQKSFLRLLEEKRFYPLGAKNEYCSDFRLVAATNRDLLEMSRAGEFRADLYYRICGQQLHIPALRERPEDIRDLVFYYVDRICERMNIPVKKIYPEFLEALEGLGWPGNVRELVNTLDEAISSFPEDPALHVRHLPTRIRAVLRNDKRGSTGETGHESCENFNYIDTEKPHDWKSFRKQAVDCAERRYFQALFFKAEGGVKEMAKISGLTQARVYDMIKKHGLAKSSA